MSWRTKCGDAIDVVKRLLPRYFDPLEPYSAPEYLELARSLLEVYRCEKLLRLEEREAKRVDDTVMILKKLIELSANTVIEKYRNREYREKLRESLKTLSESEIRILNEYLKLGLQLAGYNLTPLVPFLSDKLFIQYLGTVLKISAAIAVGVKKYWAKRTIRKFSVSIERLARKMVEELEIYGRKLEVDAAAGIVSDIVGGVTSSQSLVKITEELYREQVYVNTPEVIAFARELQELRKELLETK